MTSRSRKIREGHLRLVLTMLIAFLSHQEIAVSQEQIESVPNSPNAQGSVVTMSPSQTPLDDVLIREGDLLQISLYGVPDFNRHVRVDANGDVSLPMIGAVKVQGLSTKQVEQTIEKNLEEKGYYNDPRVTVLLQRFVGQGIEVVGEVTNPGVYPIPTSRKLFDVISAAGGTTPNAGRDVLITHRTQPNNVQKVTISSETDKQMQANVDIFPGDTIVVTKQQVVYVVGDVYNPGGFIMDISNGLTVLQALALAQGATSTAQLNSSKLIRKTNEGPKETPIYLKKILEGKVPDFKLEADDILFVPHSAGKAQMLQSPTLGPVWDDLPLILPPPQGGRIFQ